MTKLTEKGQVTLLICGVCAIMALVIVVVIVTWI